MLLISHCFMWLCITDTYAPRVAFSRCGPEQRPPVKLHVSSVWKRIEELKQKCENLQTLTSAQFPEPRVFTTRTHFSRHHVLSFISDVIYSYRITSLGESKGPKISCFCYCSCFDAAPTARIQSSQFYLYRQEWKNHYREHCVSIESRLEWLKMTEKPF